MKIMIKAAVAMMAAIATSAHAAVPGLVVAAVDGCCAVGAACCAAGGACC